MIAIVVLEFVVYINARREDIKLNKCLELIELITHILKLEFP